jgi:hypothetical protein
MKHHKNCASQVFLILQLLASAVALQLFSPGLWAQPALALSAGGTTVTVYDNSTIPPVDNNVSDGAISLSGGFPGWLFTSASGTTKPTFGSTINAALDLNVSAQGLGTLTNIFSEQHFDTFTSRTLLATLSGGTFDPNCGVTARVFYGSALFDRAQLLFEISTTSPEFSLSTNVTLPALTNYSLTCELILDRNPATGFPTIFVANLQAQLATVLNLAGRTELGTNGPPIPGVVINLSSNGVPVASAITDANGQYLLQQVPSGDYTVTPSSPDFEFSPPRQFISAQVSASLPPFVGEPRLQIERAESAIQLSWAGAGTNLQLQSTFALPANWTNVTNPPTLQLGRLQVTVPMNPPAQYFRLIAP